MLEPLKISNKRMKRKTSKKPIEYAVRVVRGGGVHPDRRPTGRPM